MSGIIPVGALILFLVGELRNAGVTIEACKASRADLLSLVVFQGLKPKP